MSVDASGQATDATVIRSLGLGLDEKAIEAVKQWKFQPGTKDGQPVTTQAEVEVNFRLLEQSHNLADSGILNGKTRVDSCTRLRASNGHRDNRPRN